MYIGFDYISLLSIVFLLFYAVLVFALFLWRKKTHKKHDSIVQEAFALLLNRYEKNTLDDKSIRLIFKQMIVENDLGISYEDFLETFIMHVTKTDKDGKTTKGIETILYPLLEIEREEKPYPKLEENERRLLLAIEDSAKNDAKEVPIPLRNNLIDLSIIMEKKQNALNKAQKTNKWSIPATIISAIITLFSVIFSMVHEPSLSKEDIKSISSEISVYIDSIERWSGDESHIEKW